ncbi:MAG TPA: hypothetical protein VK866_18825 [Acidimicrobiales bacterium]|nr:hypothetical protein [Acidimicrobiales bacterium]
MVDRIGPVEDATAARSPRWIQAPEHPLADRLGRVPVEVFELPPELVDAVRGAPIRTPGVDGPRIAGPGSGPAVLAPDGGGRDARRAPPDGSTFDVEL